MIIKNKKSLFSISPHISKYVGNLSNGNTVSRQFLPIQSITCIKVKIRSEKFNKKLVMILLRKKPQFIRKLDLSDWFYLNDRHLRKILEHFECINTLSIDNCHHLLTLPKQPFLLEISQQNLWRVYNHDEGMQPEDIIRIQINAYNYISCHHECKTHGVASCLKQLKRYCLFNSASFLVYMIDTLLDSLTPLKYEILKIVNESVNKQVLSVKFNSFYGTRKLEWTYEYIYCKWYLANINWMF